MKKVELWVVLICLSLSVQAFGQHVMSDLMQMSIYADRISEDNIKEYLTVLSADDMEGREAGHPGNIKAAQYLAKQLNRFGFESPVRTQDYFQYFPLYKQEWKVASIAIDNEDYRFLSDFYALPSQNPNLPSFVANEIIDLGYGMNSGQFNDFEEGDLANRIVLIREGKPNSGGMNGSMPAGLENEKLRAAREAGVRLILVVSDNYSQRLARYRNILSRPTISIKTPKSKRTNVIYISPRMAERIMKGYSTEISDYNTDKYLSGKSGVKPVVIRKHIDLALHKVTDYEYIPNVVGYLPGKDPVLRQEILVLSAHFDHLGMDGEEIYNGADDDGSGTSTLLEIARVISEIAQEDPELPRRSLLILYANAEEKGLLGSAYYTENPLYPLSSTITNLNVDMIGRRDAVHKQNPYYTYIIGSDKLSTDLHKINEEVNQSLTNLELDYTYNDEADPNRFYYRSDHYNFAKNNIPVIFYFTGVHEDYHKPTDTIEKIEFAKMTTIGKLIFGTTWELLNRDHRPRVDK